MMMFWKGYSKKLKIVLDELKEGFKILVELIINMTNINALGKPPKKKVKQLHNKCELSPKMENPPPPISQQF